MLSFETLFEVTLPEDYRSFLLQMGNGEAGPSYGVQALALPTSTDEPLELEHPLRDSFPLSNGYNIYDMAFVGEVEEK